MNRWYVIQTKPICEDQVSLRLEKASFEVFNPKIKAFVRGKYSNVERQKSLFPSYVFIKLNLNDAHNYHMIKYTRGVRKIVGAGSFPIPIPGFVIDAIKDRMDGKEIVGQHGTLQKGDTVRIIDGILADVVGILAKPVSAAGRVRVLLNIMKRWTQVEMHCANLEKLPV
ncbi:hypothetical protein KKA47_02205 [bacterium]|nr:hypothetical protein [bacterium]